MAVIMLIHQNCLLLLSYSNTGIADAFGRSDSIKISVPTAGGATQLRKRRKVLDARLQQLDEDHDGIISKDELVSGAFQLHHGQERAWSATTALLSRSVFIRCQYHPAVADANSAVLLRCCCLLLYKTGCHSDATWSSHHSWTSWSIASTQRRGCASHICNPADASILELPPLDVHRHAAGFSVGIA